MATTNYNLPTISGNMTADVVRDVNALAEATDVALKDAVDGKADSTDLSTLNTTVTEHLAENNQSAHGIDNIVGLRSVLDAGSMVLIATLQGNGVATQLDFTNIPQTYKKLIIRMKKIRHTGPSVDQGGINIRINGESAVGSYGGIVIPNSGTSNMNSNLIAFNPIYGVSTMGSYGFIEFPNYNNSDENKIAMCDAITINNTEYVTSSMLRAVTKKTTPITSISIFSHSGFKYDSTSIFELYGVK